MIIIASYSQFEVCIICNAAAAETMRQKLTKYLLNRCLPPHSPDSAQPA